MDKIDIVNKYSTEIRGIKSIIIQLKSDNIWEYKQRRGVPTAATLAGRLENRIYDLINKIENNIESDSVALYEALNKI